MLLLNHTSGFKLFTMAFWVSRSVSSKKPSIIAIAIMHIGMYSFLRPVSSLDVAFLYRILALLLLGGQAKYIPACSFRSTRTAIY